MKTLLFALLIWSFPATGYDGDHLSFPKAVHMESARIAPLADCDAAEEGKDPVPLGGKAGSEPDFTQAATINRADYTGSSACKECHVPEYYYWMRTPHSYMAKTAETERLIASAPINSSDFPFSQEQVSIVLGNLKKQVYLMKVGDEHHFLPKQYNIDANKWEPFDVDEWEPIPDPKKKRRSPKVLTWNNNCAGCHTTGYDPSSKSFVELSIGCEECHGPGAKHARTKHKDDIVNPASLAPELAVSICAQCHARGVAKNSEYPFAADFIPGENIAEYFLFVKPAYGKNTEFFWGNGMAGKHHQQFQEFIQSRHYMLGLTCLDCHKGHRLKLRKPPSMSRSVLMTIERRFVAARAYSMCVKCHIRPDSDIMPEHRTTLFANQEEHSHHPSSIIKAVRPGDPDAGIRSAKMLCNDCHMPPTAPKEVSFDMHTHTFRVPDALSTDSYGVPNGCSGCHADKSTEWVTGQIRKFWLTENVIGTHFERFVKEFDELNTMWISLGNFLSGAPPEKFPGSIAFSKQVSSMESVAGIAARSIEALGGETPFKTEKNYSIHRQVRTAELQLYRLSNELLVCKKRIFSGLRSIIDMDALDALNHVLLAIGENAKAAPEISETYVRTESIYRKFNSEVHKEGRALFEGRGLMTKWSDWIKINSDLKTGIVGEEHALHLKELSELGLIQYQIRLK